MANIKTLLWVFGGTAIGKKHFIRRAVAEPQQLQLGLDRLYPVWIADGERGAAQIFHEDLNVVGPGVDETDATNAAVILRWQWSREHIMQEILASYPDDGLRHIIYLVKALPSIQVARVVAREGFMKFDERALIRECEEIDFLVQTLSAKWRLPVYFVDGSK